MARKIELGAMPAAGQSRARYPWDEWFDGSAWELVRGEDFLCSTSSFWSTAKMAALSRQFPVEVVIRGDRVYLQAQR